MRKRPRAGSIDGIAMLKLTPHVDKRPKGNVPAPGNVPADTSVGKVETPVEGKPPVDVTKTAGQIVDKGDTALHKKNTDAAKQAGATHGGKTLGTSPAMARFQKVGAQHVAHTQDVERGERLQKRARRVVTADELNVAARETLAPLLELIGKQPDPKRYNEATWQAFQQAAALDPAVLAAVGDGLGKQPPALPDGLPAALLHALAQPGVDKETVGLLVSARALTRTVVAAELPNLTADEVSALSRVVHDEGYFKEQARRVASPTSLLCGANDGAVLLDDKRLALLTPAVQARFTLDARIAGAGTEAAMPRLSLADLMAGGAEQALAFLTLSGKDTTRAWPELGGVTPQQFLTKKSDETDAAYTARLQSKQVFNPFARSFTALEKDARQLGAAGGADVADKQLAFFQKKQEPALAPALLLVSTPSLFAKATGADAKDTLGGLMQLCWRVQNPQLSFSEPMVSAGIAELTKTHKEQIEKDVQLGKVVIHAEMTRALSGLRDDSYDARLQSLLTERGIPVPSDHVAQALARLVRDVGADNKQLQALLPGIDMTRPEVDVVAQLHALRHDPSLFPLALAPAPPATIGGARVQFASATKGVVLPEVVGATTVGYRVTLQQPLGGIPAGESVLLRVPKGARLVQGADGALQVHTADATRLAGTAARAADFEVMDRRVRVTKRARIEIDGVSLVVEKRAARASAAEQLRRGAAIGAQDVDALADQYLRGLFDVDPKTRPHGLFYELGPDNYVIDQKGVCASYVDVAMLFRTERERATFGFFQGGYGSAANWIVGANTPMSPAEVQYAWRSATLPPAQLARRALFGQALLARLDPRHPTYTGVPPAVRDRAIEGLTRDARSLGLIA